jgi:hypothetical protein
MNTRYRLRTAPRGALPEITATVECRKHGSSNRLPIAIRAGSGSTARACDTSGSRFGIPQPTVNSWLFGWR